MAESATAAVVVKPLEKPALRRGFVPGNPGNSGGKPGRSGRPKDDLRAKLKAIAVDPGALSAVRSIATDAEHPQCVRANAALWDVVIPKEQRHIVEGAPPPLVVVFRHE